MLILIVIITPILIAAIVSFPGFMSFVKLCLSLRHIDKKTREEKVDQWIRKTSDKLQQRKIPLTTLQKTKPIVISQLWTMLHYLWFLHFLPIVILNIVLYFRFGVRFTWRLPLSVYALWDLLLLALSFYYAYHHNMVPALILAILVGVTMIRSMGFQFEKRQGTLKMLTMPLHKLKIKEVFLEGMIVVLSFAAIYYSMDKMSPEVFKSNLTILDSIYFSIMTVATVGYGDISPLSFSSKLVCVLEVCFGIVFLIFIITTYVTIWLKRHTEDSNNQNSNQEGNMN